MSDEEFRPQWTLLASLGGTDVAFIAGEATGEATGWITHPGSALARIRERPAYAQLRERAREIERLKTEF